MRKSQRGGVALLALLALLVLFTASIGMLEFGNAVLLGGKRGARVTAARAVAEAGIDFAYARYAFTSSALPYASGARTFGEGTFDVTVSDNTTSIQKTLKFVSTGTVRGDSVTVTRVVADPLVKNAISGTVFEDVGYGGGVGRSLSDSAGVGRDNARVELYDASGNFVASTLTDSGGHYTFAAILAGSQAIVRVVSATVTSSRPGAVGTLVPVQTFRVDASSGTAVAVTDHVGGENPDRLDAGNGGTTLDALTTTTTTPQAISAVAMGSADLTGIDFGFNFDTVVNVNDSGRGSLRQVLTNANALSNAGLAQNGRPAGIENVVFMLADGTARPGTNTGMPSQFNGGAASIQLRSSLPGIADAVVLDATLQAGYDTNLARPIVELNGIGAGTAIGLNFSGSVSGSVVRGFSIDRMQGNGKGGDLGSGIVVAVTSNGGVTLQANWLGVAPDGTAAGNTHHGVALRTSPVSSLVGGTGAAATRNVISNNGVDGIALNGASNVTVQGNYIGVNPAGTAAMGNGRYGIGAFYTITSGAIGGTTAGAGNVISGNRSGGVYLGSGTISGVTVQGNAIGTDPTGTVAIGNQSDGISIIGAANNTIGGSASGARNLLSGNTGSGVFVNGAGATGNVIQGNYIGTDAAGSAAIANGGNGIKLVAASNNTIGGSASGAGNLISGNATNGIAIYYASGSTNARNNAIQGNSIGTNATGTVAIANAGAGIYLLGAMNNTIGGTATGAGNLISGNGTDGINITFGEATWGDGSGTTIQGNYIGTNATGNAAMANTWSGIKIDGASNNTIGGATAGARNVVSGNAQEGIYLLANAANNVIQGNYIGTSAAGTAAIRNGFSGVWVYNGSGNTIGGAASGERNVICGNALEGVALGTGSGNIVQGNWIGLAANGTTTLGNSRWGITIYGSGSNNAIGGTNTGEGNVVTGSGTVGIWVQSGSTSNAIRGNAIYGNAGLGIDLGTIGVTANNGTKNSGLANGDMDYPVITGATLIGTQLYVTGYVGSASGQTTFGGARVEVFKSSNHASGYGEGQTYLGTVTANSDGTFDATFTIGGNAVVVGDKLTATATDAANDTSEFGPNRSVASQLVANGGFELPTGGGVAFTTYAAGSTTLTSWTIASGDIDHVQTEWQTSEGARSLDLCGNSGAGSIQQSFATVTGQRYTVLFDMAGDPYEGVGIKQMRVSAAGITLDYSHDIAGKSTANMGWTTRTLNFTATSTTTTLTFTSLTGGTCGPALDDVRALPGTF